MIYSRAIDLVISQHRYISRRSWWFDSQAGITWGNWLSWIDGRIYNNTLCETYQYFPSPTDKSADDWFDCTQEIKEVLYAFFVRDYL